MKKKTLLIIDDDTLFNGLLRRQMEGMGFAAVGAGSWAEAQQKLGEIEPNAIILDYKLPDSNAEQILAEIRNQYPVIVLTGYGSIPNAVLAIRHGAADFLTKPVNLDELELTVRRVLETAELRESNQFYRTQLASRRPGPLVFESAAMREVQAMIDAVGPTDTTVLILGESGTGKEMIAQAIHDRSPRAQRELVAIDGSGLQESLFESELFGHERGAFTGADRQKKGLIEEAAGSTLFLDEIGDIGTAIQAKLLRVMETSTFRRLGGNKTLTTDARFIAATNRDIGAMSRSGSFRSDLFFRLSRFVITAPTLRSRREDVEPLARHFLALLSRTGPMTLTPEALRILSAYDWPGNVRELRNAIERAVILARPGTQVRAEHLAFIPREQTGEVVLRFEHEPTLDEIEREYLREVMVRYGGHRLKVATVLGISERHVYRLLERHGESL
ncbi:MAG TPA: sigma-54 dependent transcriptional regulator [Accumulibacter sp.]|uniref:sigma-54-dependent transcriptional regulator n=1 Tax=Accumulibacter sp. TaxID=2053492 RepID=UPI002C0EEF95|nr:sigma-54 dependent transcriptional regulator [Accumulibacter sp.]HMV05741.1 sigma-54 dependent transcriptional regulator [Accumulibacter sp.]HMW64442.1 sigma-54 dependent transcriptional regulator [Accumulibacter sp.]HNB68929.1 sigma-54 dependent transcriptional regulator [Accumulibacter sp.]HNC28272.1 sigma-54 dependent transcriptional regulator [Accumulibacter sp.]HNE40780.1 sigma-54 dependent transcriptional regulator [Accumulibacter sp.]